MEGYKELLDKLSELVNALENGALSLDQLNELETTTRTLHERSIILRYKAYESSVLGEENDTSDEAEVAEDEISEAIATEVVESTEEKDKEAAEEEPAFDFSMFNEEESEETEELPTIDFGGASEETLAIEPEPENIPEPSVPEPVATIDPVIEDIAPVTSDETAEAITPELESSDSIVSESSDLEDESSEAEVITPEPEVAESTSPTPAAGSFLDRFAQQDNSLAGRFSAGPLESLIGAFGLNERLRFINDLFDGSSEKFSDAIKALDSQSDLDAAKVKVAGYAEDNEWDPEEEVVAEFMNYLNRRYA